MRAAEIRLKHLIRVPRYAIPEAVRLLPLTAWRTATRASVGMQLVEKFQWKPTEPFPLPRLTLESLAILRPQGCPLARVLACVWPSHFSNRYCMRQSYVGRALQHAVIHVLRCPRQSPAPFGGQASTDTKRSSTPMIESTTGVLAFILVGPVARGHIFILIRS